MVELKANFWSRSQQDEGFNHCRMLDKSYPIKAASAQARPDVPLKLHQQKKKKVVHFSIDIKFKKELIKW